MNARRPPITDPIYGDPFAFWRKYLLEPESDVWLAYYSPEDVAEWAGFLGPRVPKILQESVRRGLAKLNMMNPLNA